MPPNSTITKGKVIDEVWQKQSDHPDKHLLLQLIALEDGRKEIRVGYYIKVRTEGPNFGRFWWGESALMAPLQDFKALISKAEQKHWLNTNNSA